MAVPMQKQTNKIQRDLVDAVISLSLPHTIQMTESKPRLTMGRIWDRLLDISEVGFLYLFN